MEHNEMIEKLHSQAGISEHDAEDALKRSGWDMLEALQILEKEGKIAPLTSSMTTIETNGGYEEVKATASHKSKNSSDFWSRFAAKLKEIILAACENSFIIRRKGEIILNIPVIIIAIIVICAFEISLIALLAGLFLDCQYSIEKSGRKFGGSSADENGKDNIDNRNEGVK